MHNDDRRIIVESLLALSTSRNRSVAARVREIIDDIEHALHAGVKTKDVFDVLAKNGFSGTFRSFELAIYRVRKEKKKQIGNTATWTHSLPIASQGSTEVSNPLRVLSGKPKDGEFNPTKTVNFELDKPERK